MEIKNINDKIVLLTFDDQIEAANAMIRFQEYYESPDPTIRGKIFTTGYLKHRYSVRPRSRAGGFLYVGGRTYEGDYNGFNFPSKTLKPFIRGFFDPLTLAEAEIVEIFKYRTDDFYIIAVHSDGPSEDHCLDHEIAHGLYGTNPEYKRQVDEYFSVLSEDQCSELAKFQKVLIDWGYADDPYIMRDESHAYLGVDYDWLATDKADVLRQHGVDIAKLQCLGTDLKKLFDLTYKANQQEDK